MITVILVSQSHQNLLLAKTIHEDKRLNNHISLVLLETCANHPNYPNEYNMIFVGNGYLIDDDIECNNKEVDINVINDSYHLILDKIKTDKVILVSSSNDTLSGGVLSLYKKLVLNGKSVFVIMTSPFEFESNKKKDYSNYVINELKKNSCNYILIDQNKYLKNKDNTIISIYKQIEKEIINEICKIESNH